MLKISANTEPSQRRRAVQDPFKKKRAPADDCELVSLDRARRLRTLYETNPALRSRQIDLAKGERLVSEGDEMPSEAYVVFQGSLIETQKHFVRGNGHDEIVVARIPEGGIAYIQGLSDDYAARPAMTSIIADVDDTIIFVLDPTQMKSLGEMSVLLRQTFRVRMDLTETLVHMREDYALNQMLTAALTELKRTIPDIESWDVRRMIAEMTLVESVNRQLTEKTEELDRLKDEHREMMEASRLMTEGTAFELSKLTGERDQAKRVSRDSRIAMHEALITLEDERGKISRAAIGMEAHIDRIHRDLHSLGLPPNIIENLTSFTEDEAKLLSGEEPQNLAQVLDRLGKPRASQMDEEDIDGVLESFGEQPSALEEQPSPGPTPHRRRQVTLDFGDSLPHSVGAPMPPPVPEVGSMQDVDNLLDALPDLDLDAFDFVEIVDENE